MRPAFPAGGFNRALGPVRVARLDRGAHVLAADAVLVERERQQLDAVEFLLREMVIGLAETAGITLKATGHDADASDSLTAEFQLRDGAGTVVAHGPRG